VQGLLGIRQLFESLVAAGYCNAAVELERIEHSGDIALAVGRYSVQIPTKSASSGVDRGK
jgi:ketosteroid isomerase-like protein